MTGIVGSKDVSHGTSLYRRRTRCVGVFSVLAGMITVLVAGAPVVPCTLACRRLTFVVVAVVSFMQAASAIAQHGPDCEEIFPTGPGFRPRKVQPQGDLSGLPSRARRNVALYVTDKVRHGESVPRMVWLFDLRWVVDRPRYTLIFEDGPCESICGGVAVIPGKDRTRLQHFSYRKHFVYASGVWRWIKGDGFAEMMSPAVAFMDRDERGIVEFVDFWRMRHRVFEGSPEIKRAIIDRSEVRVGGSLSRYFDYAACFSGRLAQKAQTQIPMIERNERPGQ